MVRQDDEPVAAMPSAHVIVMPMIALGLAVFAGAASMRCLDAVLPVLATEFDRSIGSVGGAASAYAFSYSIFQLVHGPLGDRVGSYRVIVWATCLSAIAAIACAMAPSPQMLIGLRFIAGAVAAAIGPLTLAWISRSTSSQERPVALVRMTAAAILGTAAGQSGGGVVGGIFGWRYVFVALAVLFAGAGAALILLARRRPENLHFSSTQGRPARPLTLLRRPEVRRVLVVVGVQGFAIYLSLTYVGALLRDRLSLAPAHAGLIVALYGLGGLAFVLVAPAILRTASTSIRAVLGGLLLSAGFASLGIAEWQVAAAAALFAIGFGFLMLHNVFQTMASHMAVDALGTSLSLFAAASSLSQALGAAAGGYIFDREGAAFACFVSAAVLAGLGLAVGVRAREH